MARRPPLRAALAVAVLGLPAAPAAAQERTGGLPVDQDAGGARYGAVLPGSPEAAPTARRFEVAPAVVRAPALPRLALRIDQFGARAVRARVVFWAAGDGARTARLVLGRVRTGRTLRVRAPAGFRLRPGRYVVRLHVRGLGGRRLARAATSTGRARLTVRPAPPKPRPTPRRRRPAPTPPPAPAPVAASSASGVFPVRGAHRLGGGFGEDRGTHRHQGQDISAAAGTPVVAPVAGTVAHVGVQPGGAGRYLVLDGADGRSYFFAHLRHGSVAVAEGAAVGPGAPLAQVGSTGRSTGPHLHFEIWLGGWRRSAASRPIDPLPDLRAWAG